MGTTVACVASNHETIAATHVAVCEYFICIVDCLVHIETEQFGRTIGTADFPDADRDLDSSAHECPREYYSVGEIPDGTSHVDASRGADRGVGQDDADTDPCVGETGVQLELAGSASGQIGRDQGQTKAGCECVAGQWR